MACVLLCVLFAGWLAWRIPRGTLINTDELLTAERSREMLLGPSPWLVRYDFAPSFIKPPLQYWLTALTLSRGGMDRETAVRLWPAVYAVLALAATGWLARVADPARRWLAPLAMALLAACPLVLSEAGAARLDIGLTVFVTLTVGAVLRVRQTRRVRWLAVAAGACFLAALQKNPLALLCWLLLLAAGRIVGDGEAADPAWRRRELGAFALAALAVTLWPVWQLAAEHMPPADAFGWHEASVLRGQERLGRRGYFEILDRLTTRWAWGVPALLATAWPLVAWWRGRHETHATNPAEGGTGKNLPVLATLCVVFLVMATVAGFRSARYVLPVMPGVCVLLARGLHGIFESDRRWLRVVAACAALLLTAADFRHAGHVYGDWFRTAPDQQAAAAALGRTQQRVGSGTRLLVVHGSGGGAPEDVLPGSFYVFYGELSVPVQEWNLAELRQEKTLPRPPLAGVCHRRDLPELRALFPGLRVEGEHGEFVRWSRLAAE